MRNTYLAPSAALRGEVISSTLMGKQCHAAEGAWLTIGFTAGGAGLSFGL